MAEVYCKRCLHHEELGRPLRPNEQCPSCGAGVYRKRPSTPRPATHFPKVLRAIFSLRGIFFLGFFSFLGMFPIGISASAAIIMLFLGSLKLGIKTMTMTSGRIEFPEVSAEELFDYHALIPAIVFVIFFVWAPPLLAGYAASGIFSLTGDDDDGPSLFSKGHTAATAVDGAKGAKGEEGAAADGMPQKDLTGGMGDLMGKNGTVNPTVAAALEQAGLPADTKLDSASLQKMLGGAGGVGLAAPAAPVPHRRAHGHIDAPRAVAGAAALFLFLWAPMALVLYLRTSSTLAMFFLPGGLRTVQHDPSGYLALCFFVLPVLALRVGADALTTALPFFVSPPILFVKGAVVLFAWALCGLYVRQHARAFDLPVDDDDWVPHGRQEPAAAPVVKGTLIP